MNKLTPIFIAGAFVIAGGLAYAQSQMCGSAWNVDPVRPGIGVED